MPFKKTLDKSHSTSYFVKIESFESQEFKNSRVKKVCQSVQVFTCTAAVFEQEKKNSFFQSSGLFSLKGAGIWKRINSPVCERAGLGTVRAPPSRLRSAGRIPDGAARGQWLAGLAAEFRPWTAGCARRGTACPGLHCASNDGWAC